MATENPRARDTLTGSRIRERRIMAGLRQADLARNVGISPSYLNLIEHNRRRIGGKLLLEIAQTLQVEPAMLTEGAEAALIAGLQAVAAERPEAGAELDRVEEFAGRFPGWAGLLADARRRIEGLEQTIDTLTDRLTHDPHLAASLHEVISTVTAIRSTASILADTRELEPEWRDRFHRNINEDASRLSQSAQSLVTYLDRAEDAAQEVSSPQEEVEVFLSRHGHHFEELEQGAPVSEVLDGLDGITSNTARFVMEQYLQQYVRDVAAIPLEMLTRHLPEVGPDPLALARAAGAEVDVAMRRLASLPDSLLPQPLGFVIVDASGTLIWRKPIEGFPLPRFGAACPRWPLFRSFTRPLAPLRMPVRQSGRDGQGYLTYSVAIPVTSPHYDQEPVMLAQMLIQPDNSTDDGAIELGVSCRICPRSDCRSRREPSVLADQF